MDLEYNIENGIITIKTNELEKKLKKNSRKKSYYVLADNLWKIVDDKLNGRAGEC